MTRNLRRRFAGPAALALAGVLMAGAAPGPATDEMLHMSGTISPDMRYRIRIDYFTTVNDRACQFEDQITGMWIRQVESRVEAPRIIGESHSLSVSLTRPPGAGACEWRASVVHICAGPRDGADADLNCRSLFVTTPFAEAPAPAVKLGCDRQTWNCITPENRDPTQQVSSVAADIRLDLVSTGLTPGSRNAAGKEIQ